MKTGKPTHGCCYSKKHTSDIKISCSALLDCTTYAFSYSASVYQIPCFEGYFKEMHAESFQISYCCIATVNWPTCFSSPAKNASWTSTPQRFTVSDRVNQGSSDTREDAQCTATTCPWETDSATSPSAPSYGERFQHSLVFMCCWGCKSDLFSRL